MTNQEERDMRTHLRRLAVLERERPRFSAASRRFAARVAELEGVDAAEMIADTTRLLDRAAAAGMAGSVADLCRFSARETSEDAAVVQADMATGLAAWKRRLAAAAAPHDET